MPEVSTKEGTSKEKIYGNGPVYINNSFCKPFNYIGYLIRKLKKRSLIEGYKIKNGVHHVKKKEANGNFIEISHTSDFQIGIVSTG